MRILVASDLSAASDEAVRQALSLAGSQDSLAICHVLQPIGVYALFPQSYARDLEAELEFQPRVAELLREQAERVHAGGARCQIFIERGTDYREIARRAEQWRADLLVVGSHGRTGVERLLLGSVAEHLVRHATCRVLVARAPREGAVLVATDLSEASQVVIEAGIHEAVRRGHELVVMHVLEGAALELEAPLGVLGPVPVVPSNEAIENRRTLARDMIESALARSDAGPGRIEIAHGEPLTQLLTWAERLHADLLVVGSKPHARFSQLLGGTAANLVRAAPCSVLAVRHG